MAGDAEQLVERIGRHHHALNIKAAPAGVTIEDLCIARIKPQTHPFDDDLCQSCNVAQTEVQALAGNRVHPVRRIANQHHAGVGDAVGMLEIERVAHDRRVHLDGAEQPAHRLLNFMCHAAR